MNYVVRKTHKGFQYEIRFDLDTQQFVAYLGRERLKADSEEEKIADIKAKKEIEDRIARQRGRSV